MNKFYNNVSQSVTLPCGLEVLVATMEGFSGVHAIYGTDFGSCDRMLMQDGKASELPAGIAHFLEHKMFENETEDAFTLYAKTGASANAFTSFDKTCYIFTATENISESLDILLSFVSKPYFTEQTVKKEQGIISQEINMYDDNPDWQLFFGMLANMYVNHPLKDDIAGTVDSISHITPDMLYRCTDTYYSMSNMTLCVAGNITTEEVLAACKKAGLYDIEKTEPPQPIFTEEPRQVKCKSSERSMSVGIPLLGIGFKELPLSGDKLRAELVCSILTEVICGSMTPLHRKLYDSGLITGALSGDYLSGKDYLCFTFSCETREPSKVNDMLREEISRLKTEGVPQQLFTTAKKAIYGDLISEFDSPDDVASMLSAAYFKKHKPFCEIDTVADIKHDEVNSALRSMFDDEYSTTVIISNMEE